MSAKSIDPQLNEIEMSWGVLYDTEYGYCVYYKDIKNNGKDVKSPLRACCQGTDLTIEGIQDSKGETLKFELLKKPVLWNGLQLFWRAINVTPNEDATGPVYHIINDQLKDLFYEKMEGKIVTKHNDIKVILKKLPEGKKFKSEFFPETLEESSI